MKTRKELRSNALIRVSLFVAGVTAQAIIRLVVLGMSGDEVIAGMTVMLTTCLHVALQTFGVEVVQEYLAAPEPKPAQRVLRPGAWRDQ